MNPEASDPVGEAVAAVDRTETLVNDARLLDGRRIRIVVPFEFGPDEFESAVGMLMQLRVESERQREARKPIVAVQRPGLVSADGRKLT